jgi:hypothetical protein
MSLETYLQMYYERPNDLPVDLYNYLRNMVHYFVYKIHRDAAWKFTDTSEWTKEDIEELISEFMCKLFDNKKKKPNVLINCYVCYIDGDQAFKNIENVRNYIYTILGNIFKERFKKKHPHFRDCSEKVKGILKEDEDFDCLKYNKITYWKLTIWQEEDISFLKGENSTEWLRDSVVPKLKILINTSILNVTIIILKIFGIVDKEKGKPHAMHRHDITDVTMRRWPHQALSLTTLSGDEAAKDVVSREVELKLIAEYLYKMIKENVDKDVRNTYWHCVVKGDKSVKQIASERGLKKSGASKIYKEIEILNDLIANECHEYEHSAILKIHDIMSGIWIESMERTK